MPSTRTLAMLGLVVLAGCSGFPAGGDRSPGPATTGPGSTPSPTPINTAAPVMALEALPPQTQQLVRGALENGSVVARASAFDGLSPGQRGRLRVEGTIYVLEWKTASMRGEFTLASVRRVNDTEARPNASVIQYADLSIKGQRLFDQALNGTRSAEYGPDEVPRGLLEHRYVVYEGDRYRPLVAHADLPRWELRLDEVGTETSD